MGLFAPARRISRRGIVLGSGLGDFPYGDLPGFPAPSVGVHAGRLILGRVGSTPAALLQGRAHYYEDGLADVMKVAVRTLAALACEMLIWTDSAGSPRPKMG